MQYYDLPFYKKSSYKWYSHIFFLFGTLGGVAISIFYFEIMLKGAFIIGLLAGLFMTALSIFSAYRYIYSGILKRFYIEMTTEYLNVSLPLKNTSIHWSEICKAEIHEHKGTKFIRILLVKDKEAKTKITVSNILLSLLGVKAFSFPISLSIFRDIDIDRLLATMEQQINKNKIINGMDI